jgi:hypothetical protein
MEKPLKAHIEALQARLDALTVSQMDGNKPQEERNAIEAEIRAIRMALAHYKYAMELEKSIAPK